MNAKRPAVTPAFFVGCLALTTVSQDNRGSFLPGSRLLSSTIGNTKSAAGNAALRLA
jgi:hypothetical protein